MTVLRRYREQRANIESPGVPLTSQALVDLFARPVSSGVSVTEETAMGVPAVYRAVSLIAGTAAGLPLKTYRNEPDGTRKETRTPVLEQPYPDTTPFEFWELAYTDALLWSNTYHFKVRTELGNEVVKLLRIPPWQVTVERDEQTPTNQSGKWFRIGGQRYGPADIMHIPALGHDGLKGLSRIGLGREAIGVALAAEQTAARLFGDGLLFAGILTSEQALNQDQAEGLGALFRKMIGGGTRGPGAKIPVLGRGTKFDKISMAAEEAQFLESRSFQVLEVARLFGIPPPLLMDPGSTSNYGTGLEQQMRYFLVTTLDGWLKRFEQAVGLHLTNSRGFAEYTRAGLLQVDTAVRFEAYAKAIQFGWLSRADIRRLENLPVDDPSLEQFLSPVNMTPSDQLAEPGLKEKIDAVGTLVRSGYDPEAALAALGLPAITHLGLLPVTLQKEEQFDSEADAVAAELEDDGEADAGADDALEEEASVGT